MIGRHVGWLRELSMNHSCSKKSSKKAGKVFHGPNSTPLQLTLPSMEIGPISYNLNVGERLIEHN